MGRLFDDSVPPRESFHRFPRYIQPIITLICGKASPHEKPLFEITPQLAILIDIIKYVSGIILGTFIVNKQASVLLLPVTWILVVNGNRSLTSDAHYAGHGCITGNKEFDYWIGEIISALVITSNMKDYSKPHNEEHHGKNGIGSYNDPDIGLMKIIGFQTGKQVSWYWIKLFTAIISPVYHLKYTWLRLKLNMFSGIPARMAIFYLIHGIVLTIVLITNTLYIYLIAWVIPNFLLVAISAALQFPSEHLWLSQRQPGESNTDYINRISHGRFFLISAPLKNLPICLAVMAWCFWSIRMILPMLERLFVCVSVLPAHDFHHRRIQTLKWPMEIYLRQFDIDSGYTNYNEFYGLSSAYQAQFSLWSSLQIKNGENVK